MTQRFDLHGQEAYAIGYEEGRRDALLEAAKELCPNCRDGVPFEVSPPNSDYHKTNRAMWYCTASPIRKLIAADQGKGGGGKE